MSTAERCEGSPPCELRERRDRDDQLPDELIAEAIGREHELTATGNFHFARIIRERRLAYEVRMRGKPPPEPDLAPAS